MEGIVTLAVLAAFPALFVIATFNRLVRARNHCNEAWSGIDTELKRRYDLVPNLVATVRGYAQHERDLLEQVTALRDQCARNDGTPRQQAESEQPFQRALHALIMRVENYPDLKASGNFLELQRELANTEDRIQAARRFYNGNVRENNNLVQMFPSSLVAGLFHFGLREFFEIDDEVVRRAPSVALPEV